jgi:predicted amidohydrolase
MTSGTATLRVAAAQIETSLGHLAANLRKHLDWIERARAASIDLLVFPELSLTGYSLAASARDIALSRDAAPAREIAKAAGPMAVTFGFVESGEDRKLFNTAMTIRGGDTLSAHRKVNLPGYGRLEEDRWFAVGGRIDTFQLAPGWSAATLICADLWNPALVHLAASRGADLVLAPISSAREAVEGFDNPRGWSVALDFYAMMYGLPIVMTNRVGREEDLSYWGGSRVVDAFGRTNARSDADEALVIAEIARDDIERARMRLPTIRDSAPAFVHSEFGRLLKREAAE